MNIHDIIGNKETKTQLFIAAAAARKKNSSVPHALFEGPPGTGKTTFANSLAKLTGSLFVEEDAASVKSMADVIKILKKFPNDGYDPSGEVVAGISPTILFFDEIHNLPLKGQEILGLAMENWRLAVPSGSGTTIAWVPRFTLIGATTVAGKLSKPFRDRFKMMFTFHTYSIEESVAIVNIHAEKKSFMISEDACLDIAIRGRGVPRVLVRFLDRAVDFAVALDQTEIDTTITNTMFRVMGIDKLGLTKADLSILNALKEAEGAPVGLDTLHVLTNKDAYTIANEVEPYLIQSGLMMRSSKGRVLTKRGLSYVSSGALASPALQSI